MLIYHNTTNSNTTYDNIIKQTTFYHNRLKDSKTIELTQPQLLQQIIDDTMIIKKTFNPPQVPAKSSRILQRFKESMAHNKEWHYRSIIGKRNFLEKSTRPDIAYVIHQYARFSSDPKSEYVEAIEFLVNFLEGTKEKGIVMKPDEDPIFEVYADADFSGN